MNTTIWQELHAKTQRSYVANIDLRDLDALLRSALDLRMLVDAIRLYAKDITILDEGARLLDLIADVRVMEGPLPCS